MKNLKLSKCIFSVDSVKQAAVAYSGIAHIKINERDSYYEVLFSKLMYDAETTIKEFENYVIGIENS